MNHRNYKLPLFVLMLTTLFAVSCKDEWDNHYSIEATGKSDLTLYDYIRSQPDYSKFTQMLAISGYDTVLNKPLLHTVWAPTNTALENVSLTEIDLSNIDLSNIDPSDTNLIASLVKDRITKIVKNHITQFSLPTTGITSQQLTMLNKKLLQFEKTFSGYSIGGKAMLMDKSNRVTANGIVHTLSEYVPYRMNIWEYITNIAGIDSFRSYCNTLKVKELDIEASYKEGVLVDSVFKYSNRILNELGSLNTEDSIYTTILPNNEAWNEAYARILPYYNTLDIDGGIAAQISNTKWSLVRDCIFRGKIDRPMATDSLFSTFGHKISNINEVTNGAEKVELSNGNAYITSLMKFKSVDSWASPLLVEAESSTNRINLSSNITAVSSIGTGYSISNRGYIKVDPISASSKSVVRFGIPNILAQTYNIYCIFVPATIVDPTDTIPTKVKFNLSYTDGTGKAISKAAIDATNTVLSPGKTSAVFTIDGKTVSKVLVAKNFKSEICNLIGNSDLINGKTTTPYLNIWVENAVSSSESKEYNRVMRIDCVILEPVQ